MDSVEEKVKTGVMVNATQTNLLEEMKLLKEMHDQSGARKPIHSELWHACAGPLVSLPQMGNLVYYFPQGHSEQVAVSTKRIATSQIPNYPNLSSQLMCQVQNITLHADRDTDEIYAQMSLQPVNSEKDVFPVPDFGLRPSKHPSEFFCKTLTASDTSTHGGFSVPRRAADKLFPPLDFTMQPPTQELVVRDLHDNIWTFRHIYRGQPKRHLLTTGWSLFVGAKRLRAGDAVLFIRDEKSQLLVGVRRANRQQTTLPSSVLSADSMHIGVLAAAAHAAANHSPFTIFYNPRACPSEFVIPVAKYRKSVLGTQLSVGTRFGMMFETEESGKRRYMGTLVGISELDPSRWPGSKWRNLQVEWDEPGCCDKQNRVSSWEIETPESLFIFPSLTPYTKLQKRPLHNGFLGETDWGSLVKRPLLRVPENGHQNFPYAVSSLYSEQLMKVLVRPQHVNLPRSSSLPQESVSKVDQWSHLKILQPVNNQKTNLVSSDQTSPSSCPDQSDVLTSIPSPNTNLAVKLGSPLSPGCQILAGGSRECSEVNSELTTGQLSQLASIGECRETKLSAGHENLQSCVNHLPSLGQGQTPSPLQANAWPLQPPLEPLIHYSQPIDIPQYDFSSPTSLLPFLNPNGYVPNPSYQPHSVVVRPSVPSSMAGFPDQFGPFSESLNYPLPLAGHESWDNLRFLSHANEMTLFSHEDPSSLNCATNSNGLRDLSDESNNQSGIYSCPNIDISNGGSTVLDPSVSSAILDEYCTLKDPEFQNPTDCFVGNFASSQDVQSQITCASLGDSQAQTRQNISDNSGGTSSCNLAIDESCLFQNSSWKQVVPPMRTYTKVQKAGSVGRSIDVTNFKNYDELCSAIECMFGLDGLLIDPRGSGWKLVYVDYENDVLLVGDDPWEEFVSCVRCIRILSPSEVQQMSEEGMKLLNSAVMQGVNNCSV